MARSDRETGHREEVPGRAGTRAGPAPRPEGCGERAGVDLNSFFGKKGHAIFDGEINDLKSLDEALELGVVKERGKGLVAL